MRSGPCQVLFVCALCCTWLLACKDSADDQRVPPLAHASAPASPRCLALDLDRGHKEVWLESATVVIGTNGGHPEEAPATTVDVAGFWIDVHEVTNAQFAHFVAQTGYVTTAEKIPDPKQYPDIAAELLKPGSASFIRPSQRSVRHWTEWWRFVEGAHWRMPEGPGSSIDGLDNHPVIHISYLDALAYAKWRGRSLPTEAQWERAAQIRVAAAEAAHNANTWQGFFPLQNTIADGFEGSAPVGCYQANEEGLHDLIGNVWEWVSDYYHAQHSAAALKGEATTSGTTSVRVVKGGSFLCANNYCQRDRAQGRQPQEEDFGAIHIGFRTVRNK